MLYTAKCFWPGVSEDELRLAAVQAVRESGAEKHTIFRGALYLPGDELVLGLFDAVSPASVKHASENAGMPCERVIAAVWIAATAERGGTP